LFNSGSGLNNRYRTSKEKHNFMPQDAESGNEDTSGSGSFNVQAALASAAQLGSAYLAGQNSQPKPANAPAPNSIQPAPMQINWTYVGIGAAVAVVLLIVVLKK